MKLAIYNMGSFNLTQGGRKRNDASRDRQLSDLEDGHAIPVIAASAKLWKLAYHVYMVDLCITS